MLKWLDWAPRCGVLALLFMLLPPPDLSAQRNPPPGQGGTQGKDAPQQVAATPSDSITVPDGTPLTLQLVSELSSATAKVGDAVQFTTPYPLRINGLVVVPKGTAISGTVVHVRHPHRPSKNGQVKVTVEKLVLPNGETGALRLLKSASGKQGMALQHKSDGLGLLWLFAPIDPVGWIGMAIYPFTKGHEQVYPAGTQTIAYFDGLLNLDRDALLKLQPPPYKGPPQVFFNDSSGRFYNPEVLFCGEVRVGPLSVPLRLELNPGTYSFTVRRHFSGLDLKAELESKRKAMQVRLEVLEDHQYWIERDRRGLFVKSLQQYQTEFDIVYKDFTSLPMQDSCPQAARPAVQPGATPITMPPASSRKSTG